MIMHSYFKYHWPRSRFKVTLVVKEVTCTKNTPKSLLFVYMDSILFVHCQIWPKKSQICCEMSIIFWHHFWKGYSELISNEKTVDKQLITIIFYKSSTSLSTKNPWCSSPFYIAHWAILHFFPFYTHTHTHTHTHIILWDSPCGSGVNNSTANAGNTGDPDSIPGSGRSPGEGNSNPPQYSCLRNPMDRRTWQATVHGVAKNQTQLSHLAAAAAAFYFTLECSWLTMLC